MEVMARPSPKALLTDAEQHELRRLARSCFGNNGTLGSGKALAQAFPTTRAQRSWMHKTGHMHNCLPRTKHAAVMTDVRQLWIADTRDSANKAPDAFVPKYEAKYLNAVPCLLRDPDELLPFRNSPAEHLPRGRPAPIPRTPSG